MNVNCRSKYKMEKKQLAVPKLNGKEARNEEIHCGANTAEFLSYSSITGTEHTTNCRAVEATPPYRHCAFVPSLSQDHFYNSELLKLLF